MLTHMFVLPGKLTSWNNLPRLQKPTSLHTHGPGILLSRKLCLLQDPREVFQKVVKIMKMNCPETLAEDCIIGDPEDLVSFENKLRGHAADHLARSSPDWSYLLNTSQAEPFDLLVIIIFDLLINTCVTCFVVSNIVSYRLRGLTGQHLRWWRATTRSLTNDKSLLAHGSMICPRTQKWGRAWLQMELCHVCEEIPNCGTHMPNVFWHPLNLQHAWDSRHSNLRQNLLLFQCIHAVSNMACVI